MTTDATIPAISWDDAARGPAEALDRLRTTLDEMKRVSDALAGLVVAQLDPTSIDKPAPVAAQPN